MTVSAWQAAHAAFLERYTSSLEAVSAEEMSALEEAIREGVLLGVHQCMFCSAECDDFDTLMKHAAREHAFFVPDARYATDVPGLMEYLSRKVSLLNVCIGCEKAFSSLEAVQAHMQDKMHTRLLSYTGDEAEYEPFFDFTASYPNGEIVPLDSIARPRIDSETMELVLVSGRTIGHRALLKYYRQRLSRPDLREEVVASRRATQQRLLDWYGGRSAAAVRATRDGEVEGRQAKFGIEFRANMANNRTKSRHYRRQVLNAG